MEPNRYDRESDSYDLASELGLSDADVASLSQPRWGPGPVHSSIVTDEGPGLYEVRSGHARVAQLRPDENGSTAWAVPVLHERGYVK